MAPLAASRSRDINFLVLLAGSMIRGDEIIVRQVELDLLAQGLSEAKARKVTDLQRELLSIVTSGVNEKEVEAKLREVVKGQLEMTGTIRDDSAYDQIVRQNMPVITSPWYRYFLTYDPAVALSKVRVPVLALNGALDVQVEADPNLSIINRILQEAGNQDVATRKLEDLNHLFQHAKTGASSEYANIEETFAPEVLELITQWLHQRVAR